MEFGCLFLYVSDRIDFGLKMSAVVNESVNSDDGSVIPVYFNIKIISLKRQNEVV